MNRVDSDGPYDADVMIVGEAPGQDEELKGRPFVGRSGIELNKMLLEAGLHREECFVTNVCRYRPPGNDISHFFHQPKSAKRLKVDCFQGRYPKFEVLEGVVELLDEIERVKPKVIIALGDTALWALTKESSITKWRGSILKHGEIPVIPTYHPAAVLRMWSWRSVAVQDLRRARKALRNPSSIQEPSWQFILRPSYLDVGQYLRNLLAKVKANPTRLSVDIETRRGYITCIGIATSKTNAICIPFTTRYNLKGYWAPDEEVQIILALKDVLTHPNALVLGQRFASYDMQYIARHWGFLPNFWDDTFIQQSVAFPGTPRSLDYLSSLYCSYHKYWKDEGRHWDPSTDDEEEYWAYNCKDCCATYEVSTILDEVLYSLDLYTQYREQIDVAKMSLKMMLRGVNIDTYKKKEIAEELTWEMLAVHDWLTSVLGEELNPRSPKQMGELFYERFGCNPVKSKKGTPTLAASALDKVKAKSDPLIHPIIDKIKYYRQLGVFNGTFAGARLDHDNRIRCTYDLVETFRFSSSTDAFGFGTNLQNIPKGDED